MTEPANPEQLPTHEAVERQPESKVEASEQTYIQGAEMLEEPQGGSFISALQAFVAWVKSMVN